MEGIYDSNQSLGISVEQLAKLMQELGCEKIYLKALSPNDNSKNQPYMARHLNDLSSFYKGDITTSVTTSEKTITPSNQIKYQVDFEQIGITKSLSKFNDLNCHHIVSRFLVHFVILLISKYVPSRFLADCQ